MNNERLMNIIISPRVSEKATSRADTVNQHVFSVLSSLFLNAGVIPYMFPKFYLPESENIRYDKDFFECIQMLLFSSSRRLPRDY